MKKKKVLLIIVTLLLVATFTLALCSCNSSGENDENVSNEQVEQQKYQERKDKIQNDSRFSDFDENKIDEIVGKYETIADSGDFKDLSDKEKDKLVEKLIVSEVLQVEIKAEELKVQSQREEVKQKLCGFSNELATILNNDDLTQTEQVDRVAEAINNVKQELQETIDSDSSSPEEIAAAGEKLKQVEAAEQEYAYHETANAAKEATNNDGLFLASNPDMRLEKIEGIYSSGFGVYINANFIKTEIVAGIEICSRMNGFYEIILNSELPNDVAYNNLIDIINNNVGAAKIITTCINKNAYRHKGYFKNNKYSMSSSISTEERLGYKYYVVESWENKDNTPEFIIKEERSDSNYYFVISNNDRYSWRTIEKICPEFWAQKEIEESVNNAGEGLMYELDGSSYVITGIGTFSGNELIIPETYNNRPVSRIGIQAFFECTNLTSITIPDSVTSIGDYAFKGCAGLMSVTIGRGVKKINDDAFYGCSKLIEVYNKSSLKITAESDDNGKVGYYAKNVYTEDGGSKLTKDESGYIIYEDGDEKILVGYISAETELVLPDGITEIVYNAFYNDKTIKSIIIPDSVTSIDFLTFLYYCPNLEKIVVAEGNENYSSKDGILYDISNKKIYCVPKKGIKGSVSLLDGVIRIGYADFENCYKLSNITIPNSVAYIYSSAFDGCTALKEIRYDGTKEQWRAISKADDWDNNTGDYVVYCTDGTIAKDGTET